MNALHFTPTQLPGVLRVQRRLNVDDRGHFARLFDLAALQAAGWGGGVAQVNHSATRHAGTVRGLHLQRPPHAEWKLVSCVRGAVWDVGVDLRRDSPSFLQWHAETLDAAQGQALLLPPGVAHGFQALSDDAELVYVHSQPYTPGHDDGLNPLDPRLALPWPLPPVNLSSKDRAWPALTDGFEGLPT